MIRQPVFETRTWHYVGKEVMVAIIARCEDKGLSFAYSREGYSESWGVLFDGDETLGTDGQWFTYLEDAFVESEVWDGPVPPGYEVR